MRTFWAMLVVLALAAGGWLYANRAVQSAQAARQAEAAARQQAALAEAQQRAAAAKPETPAAKPEAPAAKPEAPKPDTAKPETPAPESPKPESPKPTAGAATDPATARAGVVQVALTAADGKPLSLRSGIILAADLVATPAHLLDQAISGTVTGADGKAITVGGSVVIDQARDIAILKLVTPLTTPTVLRPAQAEATTDRPVFVVAGDATASTASLAGYRTDTVQGRRVQIRGTLPANAVGMPVVSDSGELLGMVTGKDQAGAAVVLAASEIASLPRGKITPLTTTAMPVKKDATAAAPATPPPGTPAAEVKAEVVSDAKIEKKADGSLLVDDKYIVKGEGTKEKPYEVTWEMLTSVQDDYDPRKGKKKVPGRVAMLDGKWVKITGYVAFPLYVDQPKELLSMLNQWDGCCIGVPPTPYDAIEVRLTAVIGKDDRLATSGTVTGKLGLKPYLVGDWLVGLFVMDDATLSTKQYGGFGS